MPPTDIDTTPSPSSLGGTSSSDAHLSIQGLYRGYGRLRVLRNVSGEVAQREVLAVTGDNGSGKSTLLRCLAGLMAPQRGTITCRLDGHSLDVEARRRAVGYVSPDLELYSELSCLENLEFACRLRRLDTARGATLLDRVGLPHHRPAGQLSSGMRQRLRWAWALLHRPRILLLDEPLQNLDAQGQVDVLALLREHLDQGLAVIANPEPLELPNVARHLHLVG